MHTWVEISRGALNANVRALRSLIKSAKLIAVVKANAYGHGLAQVGRAIEDNVDYLAVQNLDEAKGLRDAGVRAPIIILGYIEESADALRWAVRERVEIVVASLSHAKRLSKLLGEQGGSVRACVHVKVDTGMGRMGIMPENAVSYIKQISELPNVRLEGVESHFADVTNHREYAQEQLRAFENIRYQLYREGVTPQLFHMAKTEAILGYPESHLDAVRPGIGLYGLWPDPKLPSRVAVAHPEFELKPVLSWKARTLQVKSYPKGAYVGYGCTYQTLRPTRIAIIPVGYYEGFGRGLSNRGCVLIRGSRCKVLGNVCMNMTMVDVTDVPGARRGDEVALIGEEGSETITVREISDALGTVPYAVVTAINPLITRTVVA